MTKKDYPTYICYFLCVAFIVGCLAVFGGASINLYNKREGKIVDTFHREGRNILVYKNGAVVAQHIPDEYYLTVEDFDRAYSHTVKVSKEVYEQAIKNRYLIDK